MLQIHRHADSRALLERAETWLLDREVERGMALQSARNAKGNDALYERPTYWVTLEDDGAIVGCCYRTPPFHVGVTALPDSAIEPLAADVAATYAKVSGFSGPEPTAGALATAWTARRGGGWRVTARQRLLTLPNDLPAPAAPGVLRLAGRDEAALARSWGAALSLDSPGTPFDGTFCSQLAAARRLYFWVDDQPRCMVGVVRESARFAAIGLVYTPAAFRHQGHATAALKALQRLFVERAVERSYLYVDPASDAGTALGRKLRGSFVHDEVDIECQ